MGDDAGAGGIEDCSRGAVRNVESVGIATGLVTWAMGLNNPTLWGVLACFLNYIPVIGPIICLVILTLAGMLRIETLWSSFMPAAGATSPRPPQVRALRAVGVDREGHRAR